MATFRFTTCLGANTTYTVEDETRADEVHQALLALPGVIDIERED